MSAEHPFEGLEPYTEEEFAEVWPMWDSPTLYHLTNSHMCATILHLFRRLDEANDVIAALTANYDRGGRREHGSATLRDVSASQRIIATSASPGEMK